MKKIVCMACLTVVTVTGKAQADSTQVEKGDSVAWSEQLGEVTVKAQRQLVKQEIDRIGYDVQADDEAKTQTVLDVLRKVPMVSVDGQDNIQVKGNTSFKIYRNGHPDPSLSKNAKEILKAMPASMVKKIEVITDPGAKEDAEGVDAVLNIVMDEKAAVSGVTGSVSLAYDTKRHPNANMVLTTQLGKAIVSVDYGYGGMSGKETHNVREGETVYKETGNRLVDRSEGENPGYIHFADVNASYDMDSLNLLSASVSGYFYKLDVNGDGTAQMSRADGTPLYSYGSHYWMPGYLHHSWNGRMDYEHKTRRKGETLTFSYMIDLTRQHTEQQQDYFGMRDTPFAYTGFNGNKRERFTEHTFQADWVRPLGGGHKLETGLKYISRLNTSHTGQTFIGLDMETDTRFDHNTQIAAAYADYFVSKGRWTGRAGLRYEFSRLKGKYPDGSSENFHRSLNDWVPQASLKYQINDANSLKLGFSTSIQRPGIQYLNPAVVTTPTSVSSGNAYLNSSQSHAVSLMFMHMDARLTLNVTPSYTYADDWIAGIEYAEGNVTYSTYANAMTYRKLNLNVYAQWKPFGGTSIVLNGDVANKYLRNANLGLKNEALYSDFYVYGSQNLPWKLKLSVGGGGQIGHDPELYGYDASYYYYYASLQRPFLKENRLTVRLSTFKPFHTHSTYMSYTTQGDYTGFSRSIRDARKVGISVSYRFGNLNASVKKTGKTIENSDMVGGIRKGRER